MSSEMLQKCSSREVGVTFDATNGYGNCMEKPTQPFADFLSRLLDESGMNPTDLHRETGFARNTVYRHLSGETMPSFRDRRLYATVFKMPMEDFEAGWRNQKVPQQKGDPQGGIPILCDVPAGNGDDMPDYDQGVGDGYINRDAVGIEDPLAFGLRIKGDSMVPYAMPGELVICSPTDVLKNGFVDGEVYAIRFTEELDCESTVKRVRIVEDGSEEIDLVPENPRYPTRRVLLEHIARAGCVASVHRLNPRFMKK